MVGGIWAERGGEIVLATRPQFDQTLPSFRSVVASSVKFELPNTRWSSDRPNPPERDARVSSCLLQVENHMVNAARGVTRSRSRASPRARRGGDRTCGRGSVAGETRTPRGARGIARARALCVHRTPETSGRVSSLESPGHRCRQRHGWVVCRCRDERERAGETPAPGRRTKTDIRYS